MRYHALTHLPEVSLAPATGLSHAQAMAPTPTVAPNPIRLMPIIKHGYRGRADYGHKHQQARARLRPIVEAGITNCARCGNTIKPGEPWDLDHTDDRRGYRGPSHRGCNRGNR